MTLDPERVHICHSETLALETFLVHFHPKNEMKILVKMIWLEGIDMIEADSQVVWENFTSKPLSPEDLIGDVILMYAIIYLTP